jgi:hypothetical protein
MCRGFIHINSFPPENNRVWGRGALFRKGRKLGIEWELDLQSSFLGSRPSFHNVLLSKKVPSAVAHSGRYHVGAAVGAVMLGEGLVRGAPRSAGGGVGSGEGGGLVSTGTQGNVRGVPLETGAPMSAVIVSSLLLGAELALYQMESVEMALIWGSPGDLGDSPNFHFFCAFSKDSLPLSKRKSQVKVMRNLGRLIP